MASRPRPAIELIALSCQRADPDRRPAALHCSRPDPEPWGREASIVYVCLLESISTAPPAARGRLRPFDVVSSGRSTDLWQRQPSRGCFRDFDRANGRRPTSAVPRKPVGGDAIFRLPVRPVDGRLQAATTGSFTVVQMTSSALPNRRGFAWVSLWHCSPMTA